MSCASEGELPTTRASPPALSALAWISVRLASASASPHSGAYSASNYASPSSLRAPLSPAGAAKGVDAARVVARAEDQTG